MVVQAGEMLIRQAQAKVLVRTLLWKVITGIYSSDMNLPALLLNALLELDSVLPSRKAAKSSAEEYTGLGWLIWSGNLDIIL